MYPIIRYLVTWVKDIFPKLFMNAIPHGLSSSSSVNLAVFPKEGGPNLEPKMRSSSLWGAPKRVPLILANLVFDEFE